MPFKRVSKRKAIKRKMGRRPGKRAYKTNNLVRSLNPVAQRTIVKMKYSEAVVSSLTGGVGVYRFNLNSVFDPNRTAVLTGHQPYGFDTYQSLYNRYRVIGCRYSIGSVSNTPFTIQVAALPANEELTMTNTSEARENPRCKYIIQAPNAPIKMLTGNVYLPSLVGRTKAQYMADDRYQAQTTASPAELAVLNIFTGLISDTIIGDSQVINITLEYLVEFFDVKHLAQS